MKFLSAARDQRAALNAIKHLASKLRVSTVAAGTYEALHVMRSDPQIASRFERHELPVWTPSQELRRFIAGYLSLLPIKPAGIEIDKRFVAYLLELSEGAIGRIIDVLPGPGPDGASSGRCAWVREAGGDRARRARARYRRPIDPRTLPAALTAVPATQGATGGPRV